MKKYTFLLALPLLFANMASKATHIVGGEFSVQWISGNTFHVTLHFYRDCGSGNAYFQSPTIPVGIYDLVTNVNQQCLNIPLTDTVTLSLGDSCYNPNLCVQLGTYEQNVVIPDNPNGYYISYNNCCRNSIITNISNPGSAGEAWYAEIPDPALQNSTPVFGAYPSGYMCANNTDIQNFSCTDPDGDSLVYSLLTPLNGNTTTGNPTDVCPDPAPYPSIVWQAPYSATNMIGGPMSIDSLTGILTADPPYLGVFVLCVRVEEFRRSDQKKLGEVRRDIQYRVLTCNAATAVDTTVCAGFPVQLNASGGTSYSWSPTTGLSNPNIANPIATVYNTTTYTVSISSGPCIATATITVNVHTDTIVAQAGPDTTICAGQTVTLAASGGSKYQWSNGAGTTASVNVSPATTTTYTVNVSVPGCTGMTDSVKVIVLPNPAPVIKQSGDTLFCSTNPADTSYQWYFNNTIIPGATDTLYIITQSGSYSVKVSNKNGCSRAITVAATLVVPTANFLVFPHACTNNCVDFTNLSINATSYKWQFPGATPATDTTMNPKNICYAHPGSYIVILWAYNTGTSNYKELAYLVVTAPPPAPIVTQSNDTLFCNTNADYKSYQWYFNNTIIPGATDTSVVASQNGSYSIQVTDSNGCSQTVVKTIGLVLPVANFTATTQLCLNSCIDFTNLSQNATSYKWQFPGANPSTDTSANPQNICYNTAGSYNVILIAYNGANSDTITFTNYITIYSPPPAPVITQSNDTLFSTSNPSYAVFQWYYNDTLVAGAFDSVLVISKSGNYKVQVIDVNGCSDTAAINAIVILPHADFSSQNDICANTCIDFTNLSTNALSYQWLFPGGLPPSDTSANPQNICYLSGGNYDVTLIATNASGTDTLKLPAYILVYNDPPTPIIRQVGTTLYCSTDSSYTGYQWYDSTALIPGATDTFLVITQSGNYNIQVSNANGCHIAVGINIILTGMQSQLTNYGMQLTVSPNPVKEKFTIYDLRFTIAQLDIYNVFGQICYKSEIVNRKSKIEIDVSILPSGIYFLKLQNNQGNWVSRFVKE